MTAAAATRARPLGALRRLMQRDAPKRVDEICEMCAQPIPPAHAHVVNTETRKLLCACRACSLLFTRQGAAPGRFRAVPDRYRHDPEFTLSETQWESFQIPVRIAFFFHNSSLGRVVAFYPSPAGATESTLALDAWQELVGVSPALAELEPDVEALLTYGGRGQPFTCYIVPIDACYELTGLVKRYWRGFDGGEEAWQHIAGFFAALRERSRPMRMSA